MSRLYAAMRLTSATSVIPWFEVDSIESGHGYYNSENTAIRVGDFIKCDQKIRICHPNTPKHVIAINIDGFPKGSAILANYLRDPIVESEISDEYLKDHFASGVDLTREHRIKNFKKYNRFVPRLGLEEFQTKKKQALQLFKDDESSHIVYSPQYPTDKIAIDFLKDNMVKDVLMSYDRSGLENALEFVQMIKSAKTEDDVVNCLVYLFGDKLIEEFKKTNTEEMDNESIVKHMFYVQTTKDGFSISTSGSLLYGMPFVTMEKHDGITNVKFYSPHPKFGMMKELYTMFVYEADKLKEIIADNV